MRALISFIFLLALNIPVTAQSAKSVVYKCNYTDTLTNTEPMPDHIIRDFASQLAQSKDLPDSAVGQIDSALRKAISFKGVPTQLQTRQLIANEDTTTIVMSDEVTSIGLQGNNSYKKMVIVKGRKIVAVYDDDNQALPLPPDEDRNFKPTGEFRKILNYLCEGYVSADGRVTVWITNALPSGINPGVRNVDVEGGILSFSIVTDSGQLISTIEKIEKVK